MIVTPPAAAKINPEISVVMGQSSPRIINDKIVAINIVADDRLIPGATSRLIAKHKRRMAIIPAIYVVPIIAAYGPVPRVPITRLITIYPIAIITRVVIAITKHDSYAESDPGTGRCGGAIDDESGQ